MKNKPINKKTTLISGWKYEGLRSTFSLAFMKTRMIFTLHAMVFSVSAQITTVEQAKTTIANTPINGIVNIDGIDWYVLRKKSLNGDNYAMLIAKQRLTTYSHVVFNSSGDNRYENSNVRDLLEDYYISHMLYNIIPNIAVVPDLGPFSSQTATSEPTATMAGKRTTDILFAPSYRDVYNWNGNKTTPLNTQLKNYYLRWWTRTPNPTVSVYVWEVNPPNDIINSSAHAVGSGNIGIVPGVWVKYSATNYTVTYYGNGNTGGTAPPAATHNAGSIVIVADPGTLVKTGYTFEGWALSPTATIPDYVPQSFFTITGNINLYAVWKESGTSPNTECMTGGTLLYKQDFGGNDPRDPDFRERGLQAEEGSSDMEYSTTPSINDEGFYTLTKNPQPLYPPEFLETSDHTFPNDITRGYSMFVDPGAGDNGKILYQTEINGLCGNMRLAFSAWFVDVNMLNPPIVAIPRIQLQMINKNNPTQIFAWKDVTILKGWHQFGFDFTLPAGVTNVIFRIINMEDSRRGNDWCMDDIEIRFCAPPVTVSVSGSPEVCNGSPVTLNGFYTDDGTFDNAPCYRWEYSPSGNINNPSEWSVVPGSAGCSTTPEISRSHTITLNSNTAGYYRLVVGKNGTIDRWYCRAASEVIHLALKPAPDAGSISPSSAIICVNDHITMNKTVNGGYWMSSNTDVAIVNPATGKVTGVSRGVAEIIYAVIGANGCAGTTKATVRVSEGPIIWTPEANTDNDKQNWNNPDNWTPDIVPMACNDVYIPGNSSHYPKLTGSAVCNDIYFMSGGELGRPDLLTYHRAFVHLNLGLKASVQEKETDVQSQRNLILKGNGTADRLKFSASTSRPLERERWHALSSPLQDVVAGDLSFGGFPLTFMKKFGPINKNGVTHPVGNWTTPYNDVTESFEPTRGFGFYMYGYGNQSGDNTGCHESGFFKDLNDLDYLPGNKGEALYGIRAINGILELPFFADSINMDGHRTQVYDDASRKSTFYYISTGSSAPFNTFTGNTDVVTRKNNDGNYRFIAEEYVNGNWKFKNPVCHPMNGLNDRDEFLVGNPYMSSIDMVKFCKDNLNSVYPEFKVWGGTNFISCNVNTTTGIVTSTDATDLRYIAPLQGFFLNYKGTGTVCFNVANISTVRPSGSSFNLRSTWEAKEENILRIKAENKFAVSHAVIGHQDNATGGYTRGEDVRKLFSPYDYVPEVYTLAGEIPIDINYINNAVEAIVPLGLKTGQSGNTTFTFTGMDGYTRASEIVLTDMLLNKEIDLSNLPSFTYSFENNVKGIQNDRFFIRFISSTTSLSSTGEEEYIQIYSGSSGIIVNTPTSDPIREIRVCDLQGRVLYEKKVSGIRASRIPHDFDTDLVIVRVKTQNRVESKKVVTFQNKIQ